VTDDAPPPFDERPDVHWMAYDPATGKTPRTRARSMRYAAVGVLGTLAVGGGIWFAATRGGGTPAPTACDKPCTEYRFSTPTNIACDPNDDRPATQAIAAARVTPLTDGGVRLVVTTTQPIAFLHMTVDTPSGAVAVVAADGNAGSASASVLSDGTETRGSATLLDETTITVDLPDLPNGPMKLGVEQGNSCDSKEIGRQDATDSATTAPIATGASSTTIVTSRSIELPDPEGDAEGCSPDLGIDAGTDPALNRRADISVGEIERRVDGSVTVTITMAEDLFPSDSSLGTRRLIADENTTWWQMDVEADDKSFTAFAGAEASDDSESGERSFRSRAGSTPPFDVEVVDARRIRLTFPNGVGSARNLRVSMAHVHFQDGDRGACDDLWIAVPEL